MSLRSRIRQLTLWIGIVAIACLVMVSAAQADGEWKISEQTMTALEAPEASISGTASESFKLAIAWYASEIECSTLATEAPTKIFKEGTSEAILKLSSCKVLGPPFVSETCKVVEPVTLKVKGKLLLSGGKTYELFEAATGKTSLGAIEFKAGTECPLPLSSELKGTFVGETEAGERKEQPLTFSPTIESLFGSDSLNLNTHAATLKGKSVWALAAGYKGLKWAAEGKESKEEEELKLKCDRTSSEPGWYICGIPLKGSEEVEIQAAIEGSSGTLLTKAGVTTIEILCTTVALKSAKLKASGSAKGKIHFEGCITKLKGVTQGSCKPHSPGVAEGLIETSVLIGAIKLHEEEGGKKVPLLELAPESGGVFVTLILGKENESLCAIGEKFDITGKVLLRDSQGEGEVEKVTHLIEVGPLSAFAFGGNSGTIDGSANISLIGAHSGQKFGALPE